MSPFLIRTVAPLKAKFCMETLTFFGATTGATTGVVAGLTMVVLTGVVVLVGAVGVATSLDMATGVISGVAGGATATFFAAQALKIASDMRDNPTSEIFFIK